MNQLPGAGMYVPEAEPSSMSFWAFLIFLFLSLHTIWTTFGFVLSYYDRANRSQPGSRPLLDGYVRAWVVEWWYGLTTIVAYPFGWLPEVCKQPFDPIGGPPIALVHGYAGNRAAMFALYWRLRRHGYRNVYHVKLRPQLASVETLAEGVEACMDEISRRARGVPIYVICHGLGGLVMRWYGNDEAAVPLAKLICIATPHNGSRFSVFAAGDSARQLRRGSKLLRALSRCKGPPVVSLYSTFDNCVLPSVSASHGERTHSFDVGGHLSLLYDRQAFGVLMTELPPPDHMPERHLTPIRD